MENDVLACFDRLNLRPGKSVAVKTLWHNWAFITSGSNADFVDGLMDLCQRGFVFAPEGKNSEAVHLTEAGYAALKKPAHSAPNTSGHGNITIFNIGEIGNATGIGVFGDNAAITAHPELPDGVPDGIRDLINRKQRITFGLEINPHSLRISVGERGPFANTASAGNLYQLRRTLNIKVENIDKQRALSRCKIYVMNIDPAEHEGPWLLKGDFSLAAGDHLLIPLVTYEPAFPGWCRFLR